MMSNRTSLVIAWLSTIQNADKIIVLDKERLLKWVHTKNFCHIIIIIKNSLICNL